MTTEATIRVGIDIGTTSAKLCGKRGEKVIVEYRKVYENEDVDNGIQETKIILKTVMDMLKAMKEEMNTKQWKLSEIWTCGQMHGIVFWNQKSIGTLESLICSPLFNWTYSPPELSEFLKTLPNWTYGEVYPGFGLATFSFLHEKDPKYLEKYDRCGTVMDLFVNLLTLNTVTFISHHNAHSWGYCNSDGTWQEEIINFLPNWISLPTIKTDNSSFIGYWDDVRCHVASGDLQASVASLYYYEHTAYIILGTSAQLCCLADKNEVSSTVIPSTVVQLPYSETKKLLAACSMNGGNALESIMKMYFPATYSSNTLQLELEKLNKTVPNVPSDMKIDPIFISERGISKTLSTSNISSDTCYLQLLEATHQGIIRNLFSLFPIPLLITLNIKHVALVGSAQCPRFRRHIEELCKKTFNYKIPDSAISTPLGAINFQKL